MTGITTYTVAIPMRVLPKLTTGLHVQLSLANFSVINIPEWESGL
jgi:hypothetical protein